MQECVLDLLMRSPLPALSYNQDRLIRWPVSLLPSIGRSEQSSKSVLPHPASMASHQMLSGMGKSKRFQLFRQNDNKDLGTL